jgi:hypothetical protein
MSLTKEGNFTWSYTTGARKQEVRGVYALDGSSLAMEPTGGGTLLVELTLRDANSMQFQVVGAPAGEPALQFKRNSTP